MANTVASKCLNAANTTGYVITLGQSCTYLSCKADSGVELYMQPVYADSTPADPTNAFIPNSGAVTNVMHLSAGESVELDLSRGRVGEHQAVAVNYIRVWSVAGGKFNVVGW